MRNPCKKTNTVFLIMVVLYLAASVFLSMLSVRSITVGTAFSLIFGEVIVVVPGLVFLLLYRCNLMEWIPFRKVKASTIGYTILITITITPMLYFLNLLSQLIEENVALDMLGEIEDIPAALVIFIVGLFGPVCEEIAFRGILFNGFKRSGRIFAAIIYSGFVFGLFHMNLNQLGYAFAIGVVSAALLEATGSIWPSIVMHVVINSYNVLELYIAKWAYKMMGTSLSELMEAEDITSNDNLLRTAAFLLIPAIGGIAIAVVIYNAILNSEGTREHILGILPFKKSNEDADSTEKKTHIITFSGVLGIVICLFVIFAFEYVLHYFGISE